MRARACVRARACACVRVCVCTALCYVLLSPRQFECVLRMPCRYVDGMIAMFDETVCKRGLTMGVMTVFVRIKSNQINLYYSSIYKE